MDRPGAGRKGLTIRAVTEDEGERQEDKENALCTRVLLDVYKAHGAVYNGGLDEQIYDPESAFERLGEHAYSALIRDGSLNTLSTAISKVAAFEGVESPTMVDEQGADDVMRMAAGLAG